MVRGHASPRLRRFLAGQGWHSSGHRRVVTSVDAHTREGRPGAGGLHADSVTPHARITRERSQSRTAPPAARGPAGSWQVVRVSCCRNGSRPTLAARHRGRHKHRALSRRAEQGCGIEAAVLAGGGPWADRVVEALGRGLCFPFLSSRISGPGLRNTLRRGAGGLRAAGKRMRRD